MDLVSVYGKITGMRVSVLYGASLLLAGSAAAENFSVGSLEIGSLGLTRHSQVRTSRRKIRVVFGSDRAQQLPRMYANAQV